MNENQKAAETTEKTVFTIIPMSIKQIARLYGISLKTMYKWLAPFADEIGQKNGRYYTNAQVKIIIQKLGMPDEIIRL